MKLSKAVQEFVKHLRDGSKRPQTIAAYESDLTQLVAISGHDTVFNVSPDLINLYFRVRAEGGLRPSTLHRKCATLREFIRWGLKCGCWGHEIADRLLEAVPHIPRPDPVPRPFARDEAERLWKLQLTGDEHLIRALLFYTGLRVSAICVIKIGDISKDPPTIRTITKGDRTVLKHMHPRLVDVVFNHILSRTNLKPQSLLLVKPSGRYYYRRDVEEITHAWGAAARVANCLPHRFRHTFATELYDNTRDILAVQQQLDHRDLKSTRVYTQLIDARARESILKLPASWHAPEPDRLTCNDGSNVTGEAPGPHE